MTKFTEVWPEHGMDDETSPRGLMVPLKGWNYVLLEGAAPGTTLNRNRSSLRVKKVKKKRKIVDIVVSTARKTLKERDLFHGGLFKPLGEIGIEGLRGKAVKSGLLIAVYGKKTGMTNITAVNRRTGKTTAKLVVTVHPKTVIKVGFNFVKHLDAAGAEKSLTRWNPANAKQWIKLLNEIYTKQTNLVFEQANSRYVTVKRNLGSSVTLKDMDHIGPKRDKTAKINIFLVGSYADPNATDPNGAHIKATKDIVCDDRPTEEKLMLTMSHEIGHFFTAGHHPNRKLAEPHWLMAISARRTGSKITHQWAQRFNTPWPNPK